MPQKPAAKTRTWGTRFDHLPSSPTPSPPLRDALVAQETTPTGAKEHALDASIKNKEEKMPHDASVFVGSLPSNIDQHELTHMLSEHLSEHAEVRNIKVVRDSKGGVCAFVQCEDASSAARLIYTLHSTDPKPFLGRLLRYERARAFRTLLISYRTPVQFVQPDIPKGSATASDVAKDGKRVELELPTMMRLWRPWNAKYMTILYNAEARENHGQNEEVPASNSVLFLHPLVCDAETIRKLALQFGPLESFEALPGPEYPAPHDGPRTEAMDKRCWEIKWDHRDDCVSALMNLRRVPHLTVTWAHHPNSSGSDHPNPRFAHPNAAPYPYHAQEPAHQRPTGGSLASSPNISLPSEAVTAPVPHDECRKTAQPHANDTQSNHVGEPPNFLPFPEPQECKGEKHKSAEWSEVDFPPLGDCKGERKAENGVWGDRKILKLETEDVERSPSSSSLISLVTTPRVASAHLFYPGDIEETSRREEEELDMPPTPELGRSPITPKTPGSLFPDTPTSYISDFQDSFKGYHQKDGKENMRYYGDTAAGERELDPTTLFVGGLEMYGPHAWDQEKVRSFFARFGGLEHVTFVRPLSSRSGFAFVKFNNTESPARAVFEEHNRVYEGRQMRIQLRDCNPPHRGMWKYGRGRGRYLQYGPQRPPPEHGLSDDSNEITYPDVCHKSLTRDGHREVGVEKQHDETPPTNDEPYLAAMEFPTLDRAGSSQKSALFENMKVQDDPRAEGRTHARSPDSRLSETGQSSPDKPSTTRETSSQSDAYREWYEGPSSTPAFTPPPSSFGSSASATAPAIGPFMPYPMPHPGYYPTHGWVQPLPQHFSYPMPYMPGFPGFAAPAGHVAPSFASTTGSDSSGPAPVTQNTWSGLYTPYMPYPSYPARTPSIDQSQSQQPSQLGQPPLVPTGFIQGDQGSLIAVYHPEALDQYMSSAQAAPNPAGTQAQAPNVPAWHPFPQAAYPFQVPGPYLIPQHFSTSQNQPRPGNMGWMPGPSPLGYTGPQQSSSNRTMPHNFRGGGLEGQSNTQPPKRQHRRDQPNNYNSNRNHNPRGLPSRYLRGGQGGHMPQQFNPNPVARDWNQWAGR